jgi:hypothetical protein
MSDSADSHYRTWKRLAPLGLLGVGFGASLLGYATNLKADRSTRTLTWVAAGTASLIVLNAGLSTFGDAVKHRTLFEVKTASAADTDGDA